MECWRVLIGMDRNDRDSHYDLARALRRFARWKEAEPHFREVLRIGQTREDSDVWVYTVHGELTEVLVKLGKNAETIREYQALIASEGAGDEEIRRARQAVEALRKRPWSSLYNEASRRCASSSVRLCYAVRRCSPNS